MNKTDLYLSLEPREGATRCMDFETPQTLERAKERAQFLFHDMIYLRTIAVMRKGKIVDVYDGRWSSESSL